MNTGVVTVPGGAYNLCSPCLEDRALHRIDVEDVSVQDYAVEAVITANNAGVRVFRAREAVRKGVVRWCGSCGGPPVPPASGFRLKRSPSYA